MANKIIVVGIGPGSEAYMLPEALRIIKEAKVLVGGKRALEQYAQHPFAEDSKGFLGHDQILLPIKKDIHRVLNFIREKLDYYDVVVMVSGDPGYYSMLDVLRRRFAADMIQVVPGISSMQLAFARLTLPWHDAELLSFHGRVPSEARLVYEPGRLLGMLTDLKYNSATIAQLLMDKGWPAETTMYVCSRLSYEDEQVKETSLQEAAEQQPVRSCILVVKS